jgi:hypothetical protein
LNTRRLRALLALLVATGLLALLWPLLLSAGSFVFRSKAIPIARGYIQISFPWIPRRANNILLITRFNNLLFGLSHKISVAYLYESPLHSIGKLKDDPSDFAWASEMEEKYRTNGYSPISHRTITEGNAKLFCVQGQMDNVQSDFCEDSTGTIRAIFTGTEASADQLFAILGTYRAEAGE